jgi:hypothetical protein
LTTRWSMSNGPGSVAFGDPARLSTPASFSVAGAYTLRLTANDGAMTSSDDVVVTVNAPSSNQPPVVSAGVGKTITLPATASLTGTASDDGLPSGSTLTMTWSKVSGPGTVTFSNANALSTTATFSSAGTYQVRLTASDSQLTSSSDVTIVVLSNCGTTVSGSVTASATATDNIGVVGVQFKLDGANFGAELVSAPYSITWNTTAVSNGCHTLTAVARDAAGNQGSASVSVTVNNP